MSGMQYPPHLTAIYNKLAENQWAQKNEPSGVWDARISLDAEIMIGRDKTRPKEGEAYSIWVSARDPESDEAKNATEKLRSIFAEFSYVTVQAAKPAIPFGPRS